MIQRRQEGLPMSRYDLTDFEWSVIQPLLPNKPRGMSQADAAKKGVQIVSAYPS